MAGLTSTGLVIKRYDQILDEINTNLKNKIKALTGLNQGIDTSDLSVAGVFNKIYASSEADLWELAQALYDSMDVLRAEGDALDNAVLTAGFFRNPAIPSRGVLHLIGASGTIVKKGSEFSSVRGDVFQSIEDTTISERDCYGLDVTVATLLNTTLYRITINDVVYDYTSDGSATKSEILNGLMALINADLTDAASYSVVDDVETLHIVTPVEGSKIDVTMTTYLVPKNIITPTVIISQELGIIPGDKYSIINIKTSTGGLGSVINPTDLITGSAKETDEELRARLLNTSDTVGTATHDAIKGSILNIEGVKSCKILENKTLLPYTEGVLNGNIQIVVTSDLSGNLSFAACKTEIDNLITAIEGTAGSPSASYIQGDYTTYAIFTITVEGGTDTLIAAQVALAKTALEATTNTPVVDTYENYEALSGLPAKAYQVIVYGGDELLIATDLWRTRPIVARQYGEIAVDITDKFGQTQTVFFSRPLTKYVYMKIDYTLYDEEVFPTNGEDLIEQYCYEYGVTLDIGNDVIPQRFYGDVYKNVPGIATLAVRLFVDSDGNATPVDGDYIEEIKTIADTEISSFALNRIIINELP